MNSDQLLAKSKEAFQAGQYAESAELAKSMLAADGMTAWALLLAALSLGKQGLYSEAMPFASKLALSEPKEVPILASLAAFYWQAGCLADATRCCEQILEIDPTHAHTWNSLGLCRLAEEGREGAIDCFRRAVELDPSVAAFHLNLGKALDTTMLVAEAARSYRRVLELDANSVDALCGLADINIRQMTSESALEMSVRLQGTETLSCSDGAIIDETMELLRRAIAADPSAAKPRRLLAIVYQQIGRHEDSIGELERAISLHPEMVEAYWHLTRSKKFGLADAVYVEKMVEMAEDSRRSSEDRMLIHNALAKAYGDLGRYKESMDHCELSHGIARSLLIEPFDGPTLTQRVDANVEGFGKKAPKSSTHRALESDLPIFVVGMPRCGSTLVEQILSSHPLIFGAGELPFWSDFGSQAFNPETRTVDWHTARRLGDEYLASLSQIAPGYKRVIDKGLNNFRYLGLLNALFPNGRIVHCRRDPIDTCLSIYMAHFRFSDSYMHSKESLAYAYREYARLMQHWRETLPADRFFEVRYEEVVSNREDITRRLIEFCGVPWDDACLYPERNRRIVRTASQWQVRQPVYETSVSRWKNYEPWLGPLLELADLKGE